MNKAKTIIKEKSIGLMQTTNEMSLEEALKDFESEISRLKDDVEYGDDPRPVLDFKNNLKQDGTAKISYEDENFSMEIRYNRKIKTSNKKD